jgi:PAS domain S-box-containing protein
MDRELFDAIGDAVTVHSQDGHCVAANAAAVKIFGLPMETLLQGSIEQWSAVEEGYTLQRAQHYLQQALSQGEVTFEWRHKRPDGVLGWSEVHLVRATLQGEPRIVATIRDITTHRALSEGLALARNQYRLLVRNLPGSVILLYDHDLRFVLADGPEVEATGFSKERIEGRTVFDVLPKEFVEMVEPFLRKALAGEQLDVEVPYEDRWYHYHYVPVLDGEHKVAYGLVLGLNITAKHRAEAALRTNEARLKAITDHTPAFILETTADGTIEYLNRARPGVSLQSIIGTSVRSWVPVEQREALRTALARAVAGEAVSTEFESLTSDGTIRHNATIMAPIRVPGQPTRVAMTVFDISDLRQAKAQARASQERLVDIASQVPGFFFQSCIYPDGRNAFLFVSEGVEELYGVTPEQLAIDSTILYQRVHPEDVAELSRSVAQSIDSLTRLSSVHRVLHTGAEMRWVETSALPRRLEDGSVVFSGYALDVTERKATEAERERLIAELQASNTAMEQFTYTVSHDLKSPLVTIRGFLGMLERDLEQGNRERAVSDLGRIRSAAEKMSGMLSDLLDLSRVGRVGAKTAHIALAEVLREVMDLLAGAVQARGVVVELPPSLPRVLGDHVQLVQVFQNLIENAVKYLGNQGQPRIEVGVLADAAKPTVFVRDNGIGIEPRYHDKIFGLFEKLDPKAEGTGVGLALVRRIVDQHGGRVWVESQGAGSGCSFFVQLVSAGPASD